MKYHYAPVFLRQFKKLPPALQTEALEKIKLFQTRLYDQQLKVHKLKGLLGGRYSFWVNYQIRVVFTYVNKKDILFAAIGDHDVYKN